MNWRKFNLLRRKNQTGFQEIACFVHAVSCSSTLLWCYFPYYHTGLNLTKCYSCRFIFFIFFILVLSCQYCGFIINILRLYSHKKPGNPCINMVQKQWEDFNTYSCMLLPLCLVWCRGMEDSLDTQAAADSAGWQALRKDPATHATCHHFPAGNPDRWPVDYKDTCTHLTHSNKKQL